RDEHVLEQRQPEDPFQPELRHPVVLRGLPRCLREVVVAKAAPAFEDADPVPFLRQTQRRDAAAESRADDDPVVVELLWLTSCFASHVISGRFAGGSTSGM